jgi:hypothetical protein
MVSADMAWAFTRYSSDYVPKERAAIGARLGVHAHDCEKPWDWRASADCRGAFYPQRNRSNGRFHSMDDVVARKLGKQTKLSRYD